MMFRAALDPSLDELDILLPAVELAEVIAGTSVWDSSKWWSSIVPSRGRDTMPKENSSDTNLPYTSKVNSSLAETISCRPLTSTARSATHNAMAGIGREIAASTD